MNIPVDKLINIINSLPKPWEANLFRIVPLMGEITIQKTFAPDATIKCGKNENELHFRSARKMDGGYIWTLEL